MCRLPFMECHTGCCTGLRPMCMFDKFHLTFNSNPKCHMMFSKTKRNVNWHLHCLLKCHLNVTCLIMRVISICKVSIDVWFFSFTSHIDMSKSKLCMPIDVQFIFVQFFVCQLSKTCRKNTLTATPLFALLLSAFPTSPLSLQHHV